MKNKLVSVTIKQVSGNWPNNSKEMSKDEKNLYNRKLKLTVEKNQRTRH